MLAAELKSKYKKLSSIEKANKGWQDEYEVSSVQVFHLTFYIKIIIWSYFGDII